MSQRDVSLILMRQLASALAVPVLISDETGELLFFNEPAEKLIGQRFDEFGDLPLDQQSRVFSVRDEQGEEVPPEQVPISVAMRELRPVHRRVFGRGYDGVDHHVEITAFPLLGADGHLSGAVAMFWERDLDHDDSEVADTAGAIWKPAANGQ